MVVARDILIEVSPGEVRIVEIDREDRLISLQVERVGHPSLVGAVCRGRVTRIDKALGGAFIDIGLDTPAFLPRAGSVHEGESVIAQVMRDGWGDKGPAVTVSPDLAGRYVVLRPRGRGVRWSPQLGGGKRRAALEESMAGVAQEDDGIVIRANATRVDGDAVVAEAERLRGAWTEVERKAKEMSAPGVLQAAPALIERALRDCAVSGQIIVDDRRVAAQTGDLAQQKMPDLAGCLAFHDGSEPLFEAEGVEGQIEEALSRRVALPRGASLVIDELEALSAIDVNMGGAGGGRGADAAVFELNRTAAAAAVRQIMLRNIAGLIVIDFVSMRSKSHRKQLVEGLRQTFRGDRVTTDVLGMTPAGLVEITRQRRGPSLAGILTVRPETEPQPTAETTACAALRAALRQLGGGRPVLRCAPAVARVLEGAMNPALQEVSRRLGQELALQPDGDCPGYEIILA
jgi:Rne/Rng family ribonuclease